MKILYLHGLHSRPGGVKPSYLKGNGHDVINPGLPDDDFNQSVRVAQEAFDDGEPDVVVGSSRGGAVAMNIETGDTPLVLIAPAWKRWGRAVRVRTTALILHSSGDAVIPLADSRELIAASGLPSTSMVVAGLDHNMTDPEALAAMLSAVAAVDPASRRKPQPR
jgi:hypothetical protein